MKNGLGLSALILAFLAIVIPVVGPWITVLVAIMMVFATGDGFAFGVAAFVINLVNLLMLSPTFWVLANDPSGGDTWIPVFWVVAQIAGLAGLIVRNRKINAQEVAAE